MMTRLSILAVLGAAIFIGGCASNGETAAAAPPPGSATVTTSDEVPSGSAMGNVVYNSQARRDCRRKVRRTATRIPRGECETSTFSKAYHMPSGKPPTTVQGGNNNN